MSICLLPDQFDWALGHVADALMKHLPDLQFEKKKLHRRIRARSSSKYNSVFVMYPPYLWEFDANSSRFLGAVHSFYEISVNDPFSDRLQPQYKMSLSRFKKISVPCRLMHEYLLSEDVNCFYTPYGVDQDLFYPKKREKNKKLVFGFVGNPEKHGSLKGYQEFIKPAFRNNSGIELKVALGNKYAYHQMVNFYNSIDVLICMSSSETGPLPVLEAMACGVPVISTPVGMVPEVVRHLEDGIITYRDNLAFWLRYLEKNRDLVELMGQSALNSIRKWTWPKVSSYWRAFFA